MPLQAFFIPTDDGQRYCVFHPAQGGTERGAVVYVHPLLEEMNKSRRMAAIQSRVLSEAGYAVLQIDLLGCGDSSGDFDDGTWDAWIDDVLLACRWLKARSDAPLWLWGLRAGCLLAAQAARRLERPKGLLFWQPPTAGKMLLQQLLRLGTAGDMLDGRAKGTMDKLRARLAAGESVEIAGYRLTSALARDLLIAFLEPPTTAGSVAWLEISEREDTSLLPGSTATIQRFRQAGHAVKTQVIRGPAFWQATEIQEVPALIDATLAAISEMGRA
jgi:uncharacterized protein